MIYGQLRRFIQIRGTNYGILDHKLTDLFIIMNNIITKKGVKSSTT